MFHGAYIAYWPGANFSISQCCISLPANVVAKMHGRHYIFTKMWKHTYYGLVVRQFGTRYIISCRSSEIVNVAETGRQYPSSTKFVPMPLRPLRTTKGPLGLITREKVFFREKRFFIYICIERFEQKMCTLSYVWHCWNGTRRKPPFSVLKTNWYFSALIQ